MKNLFKFLMLGAILTFTNEVNAQTVTVDNQTSCGYNIKANVGAVHCAMGMGPVFGVAATSIQVIPIPAWATFITGYGVNRTFATPFIVGSSPCGFASTITLPGTHPNACAGAITVFEYQGNKLVIK